ncbi:hypothetical protein V6Z94_009551 [Aspergillus fumigatus]
MARSRSVVLCGRREPRHLWWRASSAPATSSLPGRPPLCDWWRTGSLSWASLQERGQSPIPAVVSTLERPARSVLVGSSRLSTGFGASSNGRARDPETCDGRPSRGRFVLCLKTPGSPHRWDDRSPGAVWSPAPMESVDRWPLASPDTQIPGGSRPAGAALCGRVRGVWTPHPRAVCRSPPAPARAI